MPNRQQIKHSLGPVEVTDYALAAGFHGIVELAYVMIAECFPSEPFCALLAEGHRSRYPRVGLGTGVAGAYSAKEPERLVGREHQPRGRGKLAASRHPASNVAL